MVEIQENDCSNRKINLICFNSVPDHFSPAEGEWVALPLYHIFGSDELSAKSPAVKERMPKVYVALNNEDAEKAGIDEGELIEISNQNTRLRLPVKLNIGLTPGTVGLPKGLNETAGIEFPARITFKKVNHERNT